MTIKWSSPNRPKRFANGSVGEKVGVCRHCRRAVHVGDAWQKRTDEHIDCDGPRQRAGMSKVATRAHDRIAVLYDDPLAPVTGPNDWKGRST